MTSFFNPELPRKVNNIFHHPWERTIKGKYSDTYKYGHNSAQNPVFPKKTKEDLDKERIKLTVIGNRITKEFIFCYYLAKLLYKYRRKQFDAPVIRGVTSVEWPKVWNDLKIQYGGFAYCIDSQVAVLVNDEFLGGEKEFKKFIGSKYIYNLCIDYYAEGIKQFDNYIKSSGRPCAYMQFKINDDDAGTMIFMLYSDIVPRTCENFLRLCDTNKGGYAGTPVHRIVKDGWIQGGGFFLKNNPSLDCENFIVQHDRRGVLCMANEERHVDCSTQFFVLLQPASWMEHKYVAFGQLIEGEATLSKIEAVPTWYESPTNDIYIYKAGVFNMDCHYVPINKNTHEYIHEHIENLLEIGEIFYEELMLKVYLEIEFRRTQLQRSVVAEEVGVGEGKEEVKHVHPTKSFLRKKAEMDKVEDGSKKQTSKNQPGMSIASATTENKDFDVDEYEYNSHEVEEEYSYPQIWGMSSEVAIKPEKPFYLPLTDVPYPGEVASTYNLRKVLVGAYCHETDLEKDPVKRAETGPRRRISIPETLLCALFECFEDDDVSESSLDSADEIEIRNYLRDNGDCTSFAGHVIKKIANVPQKYSIFDESGKDTSFAKTLTDDELRIIRMAEQELKSTRAKKVSISLTASKLSHTKIQRRETGFVRMADLASILGMEDKDPFENGEEEIDSDEEMRRVRILAERTSTTRPSMLHGTHPDVARPSALIRLYDDVELDGANRMPTLKDPKMTKEDKSFMWLRKSEGQFLADDSDERMFDRQGSQQSINHALGLLHGDRIHRKISADYVGSIKGMEKKPGMSLRYSEYAKKRPSMSVTQYKQQNEMYQEKVRGRVGIRLPGDSPLYYGSKEEIKIEK